MLRTVSLLALFFCTAFGQTFAQNMLEMRREAASCVDKYNFKRADSLYRILTAELPKMVGEEDTAYAAFCYERSHHLRMTNQRDSAEQLLVEADEIYSKKIPKMDRRNADLLRYKGLVYAENAEIVAAEEVFNAAMVIYENLYGKEAYFYVNTFMLLGILYNSNGLFSRAEYILKTVYPKLEKLGKAPECTRICNMLARAYGNRGQVELADSLFRKSLAIQLDLFGASNPNYARTCGDYARFCILDKKDSVSAKYYANLAAQIQEKVYGNNEVNYAYASNTLSLVHECLGRPDSALYYNQITAEIYRKKLGTKHPDYTAILCNMAGIYFDLKEFVMADSLIQIVWNTKSNYMRHIFPLLSDMEKYDFITNSKGFWWGTIGFYIRALQDRAMKDATARLYDMTLLLKAAAFSSSKKMQNVILKSKDTALINAYKTWRNDKGLYVQYLQMPEKQLQQMQVDMPKMAFELDERERNLSRTTVGSDSHTEKKINWQDIQRRLKPNEVAIEIMRSWRMTGKDDFGEYLVDTVYTFLFVTKETKEYPEYLLLENGNDMENKNLVFHKNAINYKLTDTVSYNIYWRPIAEKLKAINPRGFKKIYFSADGVYFQISLNSLQNPQTGKFLVDEDDVRMISSTRDLLRPELKGKHMNKNYKDYKACLMGYPFYGGLADTTEAEQRGFSAMQFALGQVGKVSLLPGTRKEVENISKLFRNKKRPFSLFLGANANEDTLKKIENPSILHIATHGFFIQPEEQLISDYASLREKQNKELIENAYMRSGLLLANCQNPNFQREDGVLTAAEAASLNLYDTELVVMSACETGLGVLNVGDGVMGLQRAFLQAGAKSVLISMWKVDDEATELLMTYFYEGLLGGLSKRKALKTAQIKLRKRFPEPYYWASFILLGE